VKRIASGELGDEEHHNNSGPAAAMKPKKLQLNSVQDFPAAATKN